jgi:hypothetical protein
VGDFDLFVRELDPQSRMEYLLNKVTTLRLYHPIDHSHDEPHYLNLLCEGTWEENGTKSGRHDHRGIVTRAKKDKGYADKVWGRTAIDKLDRVNTNRDTKTNRAVWSENLKSDTGKSPDQRQAFGRLERVIMAGDGCKAWDAPWSDLALGYILPIWGLKGDGPPITSNNLLPRPIPHHLVALKSVKHYCQSSRSGPLALKHNYTRPLTSPETVTYHLPEEVGEEDMHLPPIVIGSVNRYIFQDPRVIIGAGNGDTIPNDIIGPIVEDLDESLTDENQGLLLHSNGFQVVPLGEIPLDTTTIEVYNYCIHVDLDGHIARSTGREFEPSNLKGIQAALDGILNERWKGKIVLKNREDATSCSACGKDPYHV